MKRPIVIDGDIARVPLTQGYEAIIDAALAPALGAWNWSAFVRRRKDGSIKTVYAIRKDGTGGKRKTVWMHRVIAKTQDGCTTDHRDGDGLNNRTSNLRSATLTQNNHNARKRADNTSGVKGVVWDRAKRKWRAQIGLNGKNKPLGRFASIEDAAAAYAKASAELHGEFGRTA